MANKVIKLTVVNDLVCVYCYIGHCELLAAIEHCKDVLKLPLQFELEYRPYRLLTCLPDDETSKHSREAFISKKLGDGKYESLIKQGDSWAAENGTKLSWSGVVSQSMRAHRLSRKAYLMGGQRYQQPLLTALFKAYFEHEKDIADFDVLSDVAEEVGLMTKDDALAFLESGELKTEVEHMAEEVRKNGVPGIPLTVVDGKWAINGSQKKEVFIQIFQKLATCGAPSCDNAPLPAPVVEAAYA